MSSLQITLVALVSVLTFWAVGAFNRLMGLRNAILSGFGPVDQQLTARHALLQRKIAALVPAQPEATDAFNALQAAATQAQAAVAHARSRPGAAGAVESLRMAEGILLQAHGRLPAALAPEAELEALDSQLAAVDTALQFARSRFNEAVMEYNLAVHQFPTSLLAGLFGFRRASEF
jgi:LemA protein